MTLDNRCRILAIIGSGETSPTMVTVHRHLLSRLGLSRPQAILLATAYAFQENAADVSARAQCYFADSVGLAVRITPGTSPNADPAMAAPMIGGDTESTQGAGTEQASTEQASTEQASTVEAGTVEAGTVEAGTVEAGTVEAGTVEADLEGADIRAADWVFAGPGSPSYALAHWQAGPVAAALRERVLAGGGLTVLASAAAVTAGQFALPVYEIYKAGGALRWLAGLDLLGALGLKVAVIPHYDNAEGGRYDTRHCYLGTRRLAVMERELPADAAVLGVDEHTAVLIDLRTEAVEIRGRGGVTVRRGGHSTILPSGTIMSLADLRALVLGARRSAARGETGFAGVANGAGNGRDGGTGGTEGDGGDGGDGGSASGAGGDVPVLPLPELMADAQQRFGTAADGRDAGAMVEVILGLETAIRLWEADTDEDQGTEQARALLRRLIGRLGRAAQDGLADPGDRLRPVVEPLLDLRNTLRGQGNFAAADAIRQALAEAGIDVGDTPDGTRWQPAETF